MGGSARTACTSTSTLPKYLPNSLCAYVSTILLPCQEEEIDSRTEPCLRTTDEFHCRGRILPFIWHLLISTMCIGYTAKNYKHTRGTTFHTSTFVVEMNFMLASWLRMTYINTNSAVSGIGALNLF